MSKEVKFPKGMITKAGNVDFVKAKISIKVDEFIEDLKANQKNGWVNLDILDGNKGVYAKYNTFEPKPQSGGSTATKPDNDDDLPF